MKNIFLAFILLPLLTIFSVTSVQAQSFQPMTVTIAGSGIIGFTGDGGYSKFARCSGPKDICIDAGQNLYFTDKDNGRVRKIAAITGTISTIAGGGSSLADGVPATSASITPNYICINSTGDLYITTLNKIRRISASGTISTIAGSVSAGYSGDGGPASAAMLNNPQGISLDASGNIYVVDRGNNRVRKIAAATGIITTIAGNGTSIYSGDGGPASAAGLNYPAVICTDLFGNIFFSDHNPDYPAGFDYSVMRKINTATGIITWIAGDTLGSGTFPSGVPATAANLGTITGMCTDIAGNIYCNEMSCACRKLDFGTGMLYAVAGNFAIESFADEGGQYGYMNYPCGLCLDTLGNVYIADSANQRIRKVLPITAKPKFAFGNLQWIDPVAGTPFVLDSMMWTTDINYTLEHTWEVLTPPSHGTLSGFPVVAIDSVPGYGHPIKPTGLRYTTSSSYTGVDVFQIKVSKTWVGFLSSDTVTVMVGPNCFALETNKIEEETPDIYLSPNPATSVLNIEWANLRENNTSIIITDVTGRLFYKEVQETSNPDKVAIDVSTFPAGIYIVNLNGYAARKFVKH